MNLEYNKKRPKAKATATRAKVSPPGLRCEQA